MFSGSETNKTNAAIKSITMKYVLLAHVNREAVDQFKDENAKAAARAAGMAYGQALRATGVFVAGAGLEPPETATVVSVRNGKRQVQEGTAFSGSQDGEDRFRDPAQRPRGGQ
jgi:hypothetical protein